MSDLANLAGVCEEAARAGGQVLLDFQGRFSVRQKGPGNPVTDADLAAEQIIRQNIAKYYPDHGFVGEEGTATAGQDRPFVWHVDPLDGTLNYVHSLPHFSVSVGVAHHDQVVAGAVFDPLLGECYTAARGGGAWLNGHRLQTSEIKRLADAMVAVALPVGACRGQPQVEQFLDVMARCQAFRRLGSAALNLAYLAAGRFDAYWDAKTYSWDVAAGVLLVQEAGGVVSGLDGGSFQLARPAPVAAANADLHRELTAALGIRVPQA